MQSNLPRKTCWICLETEEDDLNASWLEPCRCSGSSKWIHQKCLEKWIDSKQFGNTSISVSCPQCNEEYVILYPSFGMLAMMLDLADRAIYKTGRVMCAGLVIISMYWTAATYGAITVIEVLGHKEGLSFMNDTKPIFLSVGLPAIPIILMLSRLLKWDNLVLKLWRNYFDQISIIKHFVSSNIPSNGRLPTERSDFTEIISKNRLYCGALMLPAVASFTGNLFFKNVADSLERTLWGGAAYLVVKGICKLYLRQKHYLRLCQRRVLNYWERPTNHSPASN